VSTNAGRESADQPNDDGVPVCRGCFSPIQPGTDYCAKCGSAVGQYTEYVPFVNIPWLASGYDRLRRATWPKAGGVAAQTVGVFAAFLLTPFLLIGVPFKRLAERWKARRQ
jgi:hypothetical protein